MYLLFMNALLPMCYGSQRQSIISACCKFWVSIPCQTLFCNWVETKSVRVRAAYLSSVIVITRKKYL